MKKKTYSFDPLAVHFVMLISFSEVQASITFLADQKIRKVHLQSTAIDYQVNGISNFHKDLPHSFFFYKRILL